MKENLLFNEKQLLAMTAIGDEYAFKTIYDFYNAKIYTHALHLLKDEQSAEDTMHEVLLKLWRMGDGLTSINNLDAWLKTVTRNRCLNIIRKRLSDSNAEQMHTLDFDESVNITYEHILLKDTQNILDQGIALLSPQQREVYRLCHQQGLKYEEAASKLNLSPKTVHTHMKRALKFLREYVKTHSELGIALILLKLW